MEYDKLVRDRIPEIIKKSGKRCRHRVATPGEYKNYLREKLLEEVHEFIEEPCAKEMADIHEVIGELEKAYKLHEVRAEQISKRIERGSFDDKIILEWVED